MAYTVPTLLSYLRMGTAAKVNSATIAGVGVQTPFQIAPDSGRYWGQITFQAVLDTVTTFTADLELDMSGVDANFVVYQAGVNFKAVPPLILNLNGGNIRYRWNVKTWVGTGADIWAIVG